MTQTLLANLLWDTQRIHCSGVRVAKGVQPNRCSTRLAFRRLLNGSVFPNELRKEPHVSLRNLKTLKQSVQLALKHVARVPRFPSRSLEQEAFSSSVQVPLQLVAELCRDANSSEPGFSLGIVF